jgi:hypothetical protein
MKNRCEYNVGEHIMEVQVVLLATEPGFWKYRLSYSLPNPAFGSTGFPTRYRTWLFFHNPNTNEDIVTKFEQGYVRCVRNVTTS